MYAIKASHEQDGNILDCSTAEVLGEAFAAKYETAEEAQAVAEDLQTDVEDVGLDPTTTYSVYEEV
jgi:hypothetical protein